MAAVSPSTSKAFAARLTAIALRRLPSALSLSQIPCPRFSGCSLMALVTKVASTAPRLFQTSSVQRLKSQQIAGDDIQRQHFVVELQLLTLLFAPSAMREVLLLLLLTSVVQQRNHRSVRGSAGVAGPNVHPSWQQYRSPRTLHRRHPV